MGSFFSSFFVEHMKLKNGRSSMILAEKSEHVEAEKDWMVVRKLQAIKRSAREMCSIASNFGESVTVILCYSIQKLKCRTSTQKNFFWNSNLKSLKSQDLKKIFSTLQKNPSKLTKVGLTLGKHEMPTQDSAASSSSSAGGRYDNWTTM